MTAAEVLKAMAEDGQLAEDVLIYLEAGMRDEWDCNLHDAGELGFGPPELALAARTGAVMAEYQQKEDAGCPRGTPGCNRTGCSPAPGHSCYGPNAPRHVDMFHPDELKEKKA